MTKQNVIAEVLQLSEADRLDIAQAIYESMEGESDADADAAWSTEIENRLDLIDSGKAKFLTWEQTKARIVGSADGESAYK